MRRLHGSGRTVVAKGDSRLCDPDTLRIINIWMILVCQCHDKVPVQVSKCDAQHSFPARKRKERHPVTSPSSDIGHEKDQTTLAIQRHVQRRSRRTEDVVQTENDVKGQAIAIRIARASSIDMAAERTWVPDNDGVDRLGIWTI